MEQKNLLKGYKLLGIAAIGAILILSVLISGCVEEKPKTQINETKKETKIWVDSFNRTVEVPVHPKRIITLSTHNTEILFKLGLGDRIVGASHYFYVPKPLKQLPDCGTTSKPNFEVILNLSPDLIIVHDYTGCCGMTKKKYMNIIKRFEKYNLTVVVNPPFPYTIYEFMDYIKYEGKLVGEEEKAERVIEEMKKKLNFVKEKVKNLKDNEKPTVAMVSPPYGEKLYVKTLSSPIEDAGGINIFKGIGSHRISRASVQINPEALLDKNPDVIIIPYLWYGRDISKGKTKNEIEKEVMKKMEKIPGWNKLKAVKNNRVCVVDYYKIFGTPRIADGLVEVAKCIHPELFGNESAKNLQKQTEKETKLWVDSFNRTVEVPVHPKRIITLGKADTEILFTMGLKDRMVGRCYYCDYPHEALKLPDCGSHKKPNFEVILNQSPDLIILYKSNCCGMNKKKYMDVIKRFEKYNLTVVVNPIYPYTIYEVMDYIENDGKLVGEEEKAEKIVEGMKKKLNFVKEKVKNLKDNEKPTVAMVSPPYGEKLFVRALSPIEDAGGINVFKGIKSSKYRSGAHINPEVLIDKNPNVIIISDMHYEKDILKGKTKDEIEKEVIKKMEKIPGWNELKAVKNHRVCVIDGYKTYGTPRIADGLVEVAKCIHPELFGNENRSN